MGNYRNLREPMGYTTRLLLGQYRKMRRRIMSQVIIVDEEYEEDKPCEDCMEGICQLIRHSFSDIDERRER